MRGNNYSVWRLFGLLALLYAGVTELNAQNWPQWRGPDRDGISKEAGLNLDWQAKKPALLWTFRQAGVGYSAPVIVGNTLYSQGASEGKDFAFALDTQTGKLIWKSVLGAEFVQDRGNGPRGSVTVDGGNLYLIRGGGQVHCLSAADGKMLWQKDFTADFGGSMMSEWGYSESPLVDGNLVVCTPGGSRGTMVALDKNTGALVWQSKEWTSQAGYSSPIVAEVDGIRQYIQQSAKGVAGVSAKDGKLLWQVEISGYRVAVIPSPIYRDHLVYVTSGYNAGCTLVRLTKTGDTFKAETIYANRNIANHHGGVILVGEHIYGYNDASGWVCQNLATGEAVWKERIREQGKGPVLGVGNRLICQDERTGTVAVAAASPAGWQMFGSMSIPERTKIKTTDNMVWTHPVVAGGKLYMRDHDLVFCFNLK